MQKEGGHMMSRIFYWLVLISLLSILSSTVVFADQIAITEDGKKVLLKDDGTWQYVKAKPQKEDLYDFRKTTWGMSKLQVKKAEKGKIPLEDENLQAYKGIVVSGLDCDIVYEFAQGKLVLAQYQFTETHSNRNDYISDYNSLKKVLMKKYGKPIKDQQVWKNDLYESSFL